MAVEPHRESKKNCLRRRAQSCSAHLRHGDQVENEMKTTHFFSRACQVVEKICDECWNAFTFWAGVEINPPSLVHLLEINVCGK